MSNNALAIRFTDEHYATKQDVSRALGTSSVDPIWQTILSYRQTFQRFLTLPTIDKDMFHLVLTPTMMESIHQLERKMLKLMSHFARMDVLHRLWIEQKQWLIPLLQPLAKRYGASTAERNIVLMLEQRKTDWDVELNDVNRYTLALHSLAKHRGSILNEEWIHSMLTLFYATDNLPSFYREKELTNRPKSLVARVYEAAPYPQIESLMQHLMTFLQQSTYSSIINAIVTYFYLDYIKPFELFNDEMSMLACKNVLVQQGWDALGCYVPLERMIDSPEFSLLSQEVQKTHDLTYFIHGCLPLFHHHIDQMLDDVTSGHVTAMKDEQRQHDEPKQDELIEIPHPITPSIHQEIDANQLTTSLLETHPSMRKSEAFFYARHRQSGKFYTIAQFKTLMGCAYETARTSMEHLVELGYYRKEQYKNKYVYTSVDIKGA